MTPEDALRALLDKMGSEAGTLFARTLVESGGTPALIAAARVARGDAIETLERPASAGTVAITTPGVPVSQGSMTEAWRATFDERVDAVCATGHDVAALCDRVVACIGVGDGVLRWVYTLGHEPEHSGLACDEATVFAAVTSDRETHVTAIDRRSGSVRWQIELDGTLVDGCELAVAATTLYVAVRGESEVDTEVACIDIATGRYRGIEVPNLRALTAGSGAAFAASIGVIYRIARPGVAAARSTPEESAAAVELVEDLWGHALAVHDELLLVGHRESGNPKAEIVAVSVVSGTIAWRHACADQRPELVVVGDAVAHFGRGSRLVVRDASSGAERCKTEALDGDAIYLALGDGIVGTTLLPRDGLLFDTATGKRLGNLGVAGGSFGPPIVVDGRVLCSARRCLHCFTR